MKKREEKKGSGGGSGRIGILYRRPDSLCFFRIPEIAAIVLCLEKEGPFSVPSHWRGEKAVTRHRKRRKRFESRWILLSVRVTGDWF